MPAYGSLPAHGVHCWSSPPSVQLGDVLMLIRDRMRGRSGGVVPTSPSRQFSGPYEERGPMYNDSLFNAFARSFEARSETDMSMAEYLESCRGDPMRYANAAERLLAAIGEPQMIDTARDPRLGRIFLNRTMRAYPAFTGFHGMEETIERIVGFFRHAAQGRRRTQSGVRVTARSVRCGAAWPDDRGEVRHSAPPSQWADEPVVLQAA